MLLYVNAIWFGDHNNERRAGKTSKNAITWNLIEARAVLLLLGSE